MTTNPPSWWEVCCHCGAKTLRTLSVPVATGHGPYYPQPVTYPVTKTVSTATYHATCPCNPKNGGNGICGCVNGSLTVTS